MDRHAKERLTGAVMLVALVVIVVPALLSGPHRKVQPPEPSGAGTREMVIDLGSHKPAAPEDPDHPLPEPAAPPPAGTVSVAPTGLPESASEGSPAPPSRPPLAAVAATARTPAPTAGSTAAPPAPASDARAASGPMGIATPPPAASTTAPSPAAMPGEATNPATASPPVPAGGQAGAVRPATKSAATPVTAWAVQLGAFSTRATAEELVKRLKARGYSAFLLERRSDGTVLYRVRVGPEQDRGRADVVAQRLRSEGYATATVAPHP